MNCLIPYIWDGLAASRPYWVGWSLECWQKRCCGRPLFFWQIPLWKHWVTVHITTQTPGCWLAALSPLLPIQPSDPNLCLHSKQNRDTNSSASRFTEIKYRSMSPWCVVSSNGFVLCPLFLHLKYVRLVVTKSCVSWARATFFWGSYDKDCYCNKPRKKTMNELFIYSICTLHALIPTKKSERELQCVYPVVGWWDYESATHQRPRSTVRGIMGRGMSHFLVWCKPQLITSERESRGRHSSGEADANMASFGNQTSLWRGTRPTSKELWIQTTGNNSVCRIAWLYLIKSRRQDIC